jgi:transcriptional regulator with XRE-family HTH domain
VTALQTERAPGRPVPPASPGPPPARNPSRAAADERRAELASFLRSRRERITPQDVGLLTSGRRRTPGLRREEVAQLAGVGVTWYTWLEQGRDIAPSAQVLDAIARTLQLDRHERTHLFRLADMPDPSRADACYAVPDSVRLLLAKLEPFPASVLNARYDVLAYNSAYSAVMGDLDALDPGDRNILWRLFTDPVSRTRVLDWDDVAPRVVAAFRSAMAKHMGEPAWKCLLARLRDASPEFVEIWERHEVAPLQRVTKRWVTPEVGLLQLESTNLWLAESVGVRLVTYTPTDDETEQRLRVLAERAAERTSARAAS